MKEIKALINYKDFKINKDIKKGEELVDLYKQVGIELDEERIELLLKGNQSSNFKPFIEVREKVEPMIINEEDVIEIEGVTEIPEGVEVVEEIIIETTEDKPKRRGRKAKAE